MQTTFEARNPLTDDVTAAVGGGTIDDPVFDVGVGLRKDRSERVSDGSGAIVRNSDEGDEHGGGK